MKKIPLYQTEWFGINLRDVAKKLGHPLTEVAGPDVYHEIYHRLLTRQEASLSTQWIEKKHQLSQWILSFLRKKQLDNASILSIGCGLGIVEQPLIKEGLKIDLQECQDLSISYLKKNHPKDFEKTNFIFSSDLKEIPDSSYDVVMAVTSTYCLTDETLLNFLTSVHRILKKQGIFVWYETALTVQDIVTYIRSILANHDENGILWGWKRSLKNLQTLAKENQLHFLESYYFDSFNSEVTPGKILGIPYNSSVVWQMEVFKKHD